MSFDSESWKRILFLSEREFKILSYLYGWEEEERKRFKTLEQAGSKFKVTRERIRQIESKAIRKLSKQDAYYKGRGK